MTTSSPDWENIKTFSAIARGGSARSAARTLRIHHSTVTRRIEHLESSMKVRLFDRHPDGYVLTPDGERLLRVARDFESALLATSREISGADNGLSGTVRITMTPPLAIHAFAPRLHEFADEYPDIEILLDASFGNLDLLRGESDIAIRMDNNPPQGLFGKRLFTYFEAVYATPAYLAAQDFDQHPEKARWIGWAAEDDRFPSWTEGTGFETVPVWGNFPDLNVQYEAAKNSLGLALLPCLMGDPEPELVRASQRPPSENRDIWILTHRDLRSTVRIRVAMEFIESVLRDLESNIVGIQG